MSLQGRLRDALPLGLRRTLRLGQRFALDLYRGTDLSARDVQDVSAWHEASCVIQPLCSTPRFEAKRHNIMLAAAAFSSRPILPAGLFSFWGWLGAPSAAQGFCEGRALRQDRLVLEVGGGLCQLAGAIYSAGIQAGLQTVERHAHSVDLYTDATRFTPLGSDATVSYGFKDLRLRNAHETPAALLVSADGVDLSVRVVTERPVTPPRVEYRVAASGPDFVETETVMNDRVTTRDRYIRH
jgi:vancomycin resistance protein VanW